MRRLLFLFQVEKRSDEGGLRDEVWRSSRRCVHFCACSVLIIFFISKLNSSSSSSCRSDVGWYHQGHDLCHCQIWAAVYGPHQSCESSLFVSGVLAPECVVNLGVVWGQLLLYSTISMCLLHERVQQSRAGMNDQGGMMQFKRLL